MIAQHIHSTHSRRERQRRESTNVVVFLIHVHVLALCYIYFFSSLLLPFLSINIISLCSYWSWPWWYTTRMWQTLSHSLTSPRLFAPRKAYVGVVIGVYFFTFSVSCYFPFPLYSFSSLLLAQWFFSRSALFLYTLESFVVVVVERRGDDDSTRLKLHSDFGESCSTQHYKFKCVGNPLHLVVVFHCLFSLTLSLTHSLPPFFQFHSTSPSFFFSLLNTSLQVSDMNTQNIFKHTRENPEWVSEREQPNDSQ